MKIKKIKKLYNSKKKFYKYFIILILFNNNKFLILFVLLYIILYKLFSIVADSDKNIIFIDDFFRFLLVVVMIFRMNYHPPARALFAPPFHLTVCSSSNRECLLRATYYLGIEGFGKRTNTEIK